MRRTLCVLALATGCSYTTPTAGDPNGPDAGVEDPEPDPDVADSDEDGVPDALDNCVSIANVNQGDEDSDQVGNACDNCPHIANADQMDVGEQNAGATADGVGDACDPQPTESGNSIRLFLGFDDPAELGDWTFAGNDTHSVTGGSLVIDGSDLAILWNNDLQAAASFITTEVTYTAIDQRQFRGATIMTRFRRVTDFGRGAGCGELRDMAFNGGQPYFDTVRFNGSGFIHLPTLGSATVATNHTEVYTVRAPTTTTVNCTIGATTYTDVIPSESGSGVNFAVWGATAAFRYLVVID